MASIRGIVNRLLKQFEKTYTTLNTIELSQSALTHNINLLKSLGGGEIIPVLKSNAYGHGLTEITQMVEVSDINVPYVAVDGYFEALKIQEVSDLSVLVMGSIHPINYQNLKTDNLAFVVQTTQSVYELGKPGKGTKIHLEVDTGMHRHGVSIDELGTMLDAIKSQPNLELEGVMSHLADADNPKDDSYTKEQIKRFDQAAEAVVKAGFQPKYFHLAQTPGSTRKKSKFANTVRPGIGIYGINPLEKADKHFKELDKLRPVLTLKSRIGAIQRLKKGDRVSYNGIFTAPKNMKVGVLPLGYYEGINRKLSNEGVVKSGGKYLPIVGRVCMNHTIIDITGTRLKAFDEVVVISNITEDKNSIANISKQIGMLNYEFMVHISESIRRIVVS